MRQRVEGASPVHLFLFFCFCFTVSRSLFMLSRKISGFLIIQARVSPMILRSDGKSSARHPISISRFSQKRASDVESATCARVASLSLKPPTALGASPACRWSVSTSRAPPFAGNCLSPLLNEIYRALPHPLINEVQVRAKYVIYANRLGEVQLRIALPTPDRHDRDR
jgi:hypothetical protein